LGRHFWPDFALLHGIRVDYLSPTIYLIDIIVVLLIISKIKITRNNNQETNKIQTPITNNQTKKNIFLFIILNILVAENKWVAGLAWARVIEIWAMYRILKENKELVKKYLFYIIPFWIILESGLGLLQVIKGGSLQGVFYWLGERRFNLNTIGVAKISVFGHETMRAYGTFSHPNSMAGFLLVALELWKNNSNKKILFWVIWWLGVMGIVITGSRIAWLLLIFNFQFSIFNLFFIFLFFIYSGWDSLSFVKRMDLNIEAIRMIFHRPLFGVGLNNYLVNSKYFQPVHNVYLLILSQVGIVPLVIWWRGNRKGYPYINRALWIVLITGIFDHYWMTLPQNWWLLLICLITN